MSAEEMEEVANQQAGQNDASYQTAKTQFQSIYGVSPREFDEAYRLACDTLGKPCGAGLADTAVLAWLNTKFTTDRANLQQIIDKRINFETAPKSPLGYPTKFQSLLEPYITAIAGGVMIGPNKVPSADYMGKVATALSVAVNVILDKPESARTAEERGLLDYVNEYVRREELAAAKQVKTDYEAWRAAKMLERGGGDLGEMFDYGPNPKDENFYARATTGIPAVPGVDLNLMYEGAAAAASGLQSGLLAGTAGLSIAAGAGAATAVGAIIPFAQTAGSVALSTATAGAAGAAGVGALLAGAVLSFVLPEILAISQTEDAIYGTIATRSYDGEPLAEFRAQEGGQTLLLMHLLNMTAGITYR